jgi:hypothetical protein
MSEVVEICLVYVGREAIVFDRLAWWLTAEGIGQMRRMAADPTDWGLPLMVGFDAIGNPVELPPETPGRLLSKLLQEDGSRILPIFRAEAIIRDFLSTGVAGDPMTATNGLSEAQVDRLQHLYESRCHTWLERVQ